MTETVKHYQRVVFTVKPGITLSANLRVKTDFGMAIIEIVGGFRDGEILRDVKYDPTGRCNQSWRYETDKPIILKKK